MVESEKMKRIMLWSGNLVPCCRRAIMGNSDLICSVESQGVILYMRIRNTWESWDKSLGPNVCSSRVYLYVMCVSVCAYTCQGQRTTLGVFFCLIFGHSLWHWIYSLSIWLGQLDSKPQVPIFSPPTLGLQAHTTVLVFFVCVCGTWGFELQPSQLA